MFGKNYIFNGTPIFNDKTNSNTNKWVADVNPANVNTSTSETNRQDYHGIIAYPTFARGRVISISGEFFGTKEQRGVARDSISRLFILENIPDKVSQFKKLEFTDDDGTEWYCMAKVMTLPQYTHNRGDFIATFSLGLLAENPLLFSKILKEVNGFYGLLGGVQLPVQLPAQLQGGVNIIELENKGNFATPLLITITGNIVNPSIIHLNTGRVWALNYTLNNQVWIINTETTKSEIDGVNAMQYRKAGSELLYANAGINYFLLIGDDFNYDEQEKAKIKINFRDAKL